MNLIATIVVKIEFDFAFLARTWNYYLRSTMKKSPQSSSLTSEMAVEIAQSLERSLESNQGNPSQWAGQLKMAVHSLTAQVQVKVYLALAKYQIWKTGSLRDAYAYYRLAEQSMDACPADPDLQQRVNDFLQWLRIRDFADDLSGVHFEDNLRGLMIQIGLEFRKLFSLRAHSSKVVPIYKSFKAMHKQFLQCRDIDDGFRLSMDQHLTFYLLVMQFWYKPVLGDQFRQDLRNLCQSDAHPPTQLVACMWHDLLFGTDLTRACVETWVDYRPNVAGWPIFQEIAWEYEMKLNASNLSPAKTVVDQCISQLKTWACRIQRIPRGSLIRAEAMEWLAHCAETGLFYRLGCTDQSPSAILHATLMSRPSSRALEHLDRQISNQVNWAQQWIQTSAEAGISWIMIKYLERGRFSLRPLQWIVWNLDFQDKSTDTLPDFPEIQAFLMGQSEIAYWDNRKLGRNQIVIPNYERYVALGHDAWAPHATLGYCWECRNPHRLGQLKFSEHLSSTIPRPIFLEQPFAAPKGLGYLIWISHGQNGTESIWQMQADGFVLQPYDQSWQGHHQFRGKRVLLLVCHAAKRGVQGHLDDSLADWVLEQGAVGVMAKISRVYEHEVQQVSELFYRWLLGELPELPTGWLRMA